MAADIVRARLRQLPGFDDLVLRTRAVYDCTSKQGAVPTEVTIVYNNLLWIKGHDSAPQSTGLRSIIAGANDVNSWFQGQLAAINKAAGDYVVSKYLMEGGKGEQKAGAYQTMYTTPVISPRGGTASPGSYAPPAPTGGSAPTAGTYVPPVSYVAPGHVGGSAPLASYVAPGPTAGEFGAPSLPVIPRSPRGSPRGRTRSW